MGFFEEAMENLEMIPRHDSMVYVAKMITFGGKNYPKFGQAVIVGGGAGSGKGYQISNLFGLNAKTIDVDKLKTFALTSKNIQDIIKKKFNVDITNWNLKDAKNVSMLHDFIKQLKLNERYVDVIKESARLADKNRKPNLIFDKTLSSVTDFINLANSLQYMGYEKENIHLVWVLNDYKVALMQNKQRERVVPNDILLITHEETASTMKRLIDFGDNIKSYMDGDFWITFNQAQIDVKIENNNKGNFYIKNASYFKIKESGNSMISFDKIDKKFKDKIIDYIPEKAKKFWK